MSIYQIWQPSHSASNLPRFSEFVREAEGIRIETSFASLQGGDDPRTVKAKARNAASWEERLGQALESRG